MPRKTNEIDTLSYDAVIDETLRKNGAKTDKELVAMMEDIKGTQFTEEERTRRTEILVEKGRINDDNIRIEKKLAELRKRHGNDLTLPSDVADKMRELFACRNRNNLKNESLTREYKNTSQAEIEWGKKCGERQQQLDELNNRIKDAEVEIQQAEENGTYEQFFGLEKELFSLKCEKKKMMNGEKEIRKPDCRHIIWKKYDEFQTENRKKAQLEISELLNLMKFIVNESMSREIEMAEFAEQFITEPFAVADNLKKNEICSFYRNLLP